MAMGLSACAKRDLVAIDVKNVTHKDSVENRVNGVMLLIVATHSVSAARDGVFTPMVVTFAMQTIFVHRESKTILEAAQISLF